MSDTTKYHVWAHIEVEEDGERFHEAHEPEKLATHGTEAEAEAHVGLLGFAINFAILGDRAAVLLTESGASGSLDTGEAVEILGHLANYTLPARLVMGSAPRVTDHGSAGDLLREILEATEGDGPDCLSAPLYERVRALVEDQPEGS